MIDRQFSSQDDSIGLSSKTLHEGKRLDKIMKENKELVLKCKEIDIKLKNKETHCLTLEQKASEDSEHILKLGNIIDNLRADIAHLEEVVNNVKNTQQKVR